MTPIVLDTEAEADWIKAVTLARHGRLDTLAALRAERGRSLDPEVAAALRAFYARYNPRQPRDEAGKWTSGSISPGVQAGSKTRAENPVDGPDGTDWNSLPPDVQAKMQATNAAAGVPDVDAMEGNLTDLLDSARPEHFQQGEPWYEDARQRTAAMAEQRTGDRRQLTHEQTVTMTAILSPKCRWETNLAWADHLSDMVRRDPVIDDAFLDREYTVGGVTQRLRDAKELRGLQPGKRFSEKRGPAHPRGA